ncbi:MAG TPA: carboxypeptidase regulatory-like domain-containing protein [Myxococcaceae bacterium]|nr:carboxypeptidase regulatory-like domain-containing protein [Myxococcaceae bacterium]
MGRRHLAFCCSLSLFLPALAAAQEATVRGKVELMVKGADGQPAPAADASGVVVYLTGFTQDPPDEVPVVRQKFKSFILPDGRGGAFRALPITKGQSVDFVNDDVELHNVFSTSKVREFDLGKKGPKDREKIRFSQMGVVDIFCDIHEQMIMTVLVLPNRAFAITGKDGSFEIKGVPPGAHEVRAWMRWAELPNPVKVTAGQAEPVVLKMAQTKPDESHKDKHGQAYSSHKDAYQKLIQSQPKPGTP